MELLRLSKVTLRFERCWCCIINLHFNQVGYLIVSLADWSDISVTNGILNLTNCLTSLTHRVVTFGVNRLTENVIRSWRLLSNHFHKTTVHETLKSISTEARNHSNTRSICCGGEIHCVTTKIPKDDCRNNPLPGIGVYVPCSSKLLCNLLMLGLEAFSSHITTCTVVVSLSMTTSLIELHI